MSKLGNLIWKKLDQWFPPEPAPAPAKTTKRPRKRQERPVKPEAAITAPYAPDSIDPLDYAWETGHTAYIPPATPYEAWKAGKLGHGPKVTAPRGKGKEWADRLYCEKAIARAKTPPIRPQKRQLRAGSKESRRQGQRKAGRLSCWSAGLEIAEAVYNSNIRAYGPDNVHWATVRELVSEAFSYTSWMLNTYVD